MRGVGANVSACLANKLLADAEVRASRPFGFSRRTCDALHRERPRLSANRGAIRGSRVSSRFPLSFIRAGLLARLNNGQGEHGLGSEMTLVCVAAIDLRLHDDKRRTRFEHLGNATQNVSTRGAQEIDLELGSEDDLTRLQQR